MKGGKEKGNRGEGKGGERRVEGGERVGGGKRDDVQERSALASSGSFAALTFKVLHSLSLCLRLSLSPCVRYLSTGAPLCAPKHTHMHTDTHFPTSIFSPLKGGFERLWQAEALVYMRSQ